MASRLRQNPRVSNSGLPARLAARRCLISARRAGSRASASATSKARVPITPTERIEALTEWLNAESPLPASISWEWTGEQQDQEESTQFLMVAFSAALGLMFVILLTQFNSFYNSVLVLLAVILS